MSLRMKQYARVGVVSSVFAVIVFVVRVIDFGPGIPYEMRDSLFDRYMNGAKGSGLGLSVCKALTNLFNGSIGIEDRVEGDFSQGTVFVLRFPIANHEQQTC